MTDDRTLIIPSAASIASTDWAERIAADEAARHALSAARLVEVQRDRDAQYGSGRTLHRKQTAALRGRLSVHGERPDWARFGLFARDGVYECWVRLSNGSMNRSSDAKADVRGLAIKVFGVEGASALGEPETLAQDFLLINQSAFAYPDSQEFVDFVVAAAGGKGRLVAYLMKRHGIFGGMNRVKALAARVKAPFAGYAHAPMYSAAPIACGPYAVRVRLSPDPGNGPPDPMASRNWGADVTQRLARQPLHWSLQLQPFVNERDTPIEDASVDWPTPYETVATLEMPQQALDEALARRCEAVAFDPWQALAAHRPLGELMRARKVIYFESQRERSAT